MDYPDLSPQAAVELKRLWDTRHKTPWRSETTGPDGERLCVFEHSATIPLLIEQPVSASRVGAELAWRVAYEVIALQIKVRGRLAAFLRPIVIGEADHPTRADLLQCDSRNFAERRDAMIEEMLAGRRERAIVQRGDMLLAILGPLPPMGAQPLMAVADDELALLRHLRTLGIRPEELRLLLDALNQRALGTSAEDATPSAIPATTSRARRCADSPLTPEQSARAAAHIGLVRGVARRVLGIVGAHILSFDELESVGYEGLVWAAMRYEPGGPASFATFAYRRVYGAMIDAVRKQTLGRRRYERAEARLHVSDRRLSEAAEDRSAGQRVLLERRVQKADRSVGRASIALLLSTPDSITFEGVAANGPNPEQALIAAETYRGLMTLVSELEPQERELIEGLYLHERQMLEFAAERGTSCATISRRHARIIQCLRKRLLAQERGSIRYGRSTSSRPGTGEAQAL